MTGEYIRADLVQKQFQCADRSAERTQKAFLVSLEQILCNIFIL